MCVNTAALLFAGRFGLAPTVNKNYGGSGASQPTQRANDASRDQRSSSSRLGGGRGGARRAVPTPPPFRFTRRVPPLLLGSTPRLTPLRPSPLPSGADSYTMTEAERPRVMSRDPSGFTIVDVAAWGSLAHIISAGEILGQKAAGFF